MSILDMIEIVQGDIIQYPSDLMILKYADGNHGADLAVAQAIGFQHHVPAGELWFQPGEGTASQEVIFLGVGSLFDFRYDAIRDFGRRLIMTAVERPTAKTITTTIHGPGYGLDEVESFRSQILGLTDTMGVHVPEMLQRIVFVEQSAGRVKRLQRLLDTLRKDMQENTPATDDFSDLLEGNFSPAPFGDAAPARPLPDSDTPAPGSWSAPAPEVPAPAAPDIAPAPSSTPFDDDPWSNLVAPLPAIEPARRTGLSPDEKPKLFVAMPYDDKYDDEFYIGFEEAAHPLGFLLEHLKNEFYTGDIVDEIRKRIEASLGMIALLNDKNPNVFLETGYAMALDKPIIFVAEKGMEVPFDIRNMRRITYSGIRGLRKSMGEALTALLDDIAKN